MKINKVIGLAVPAAAASALLLLGTAVPSQADHTHVKVVGSGECIVLAEARASPMWTSPPQYSRAIPT